MAWNFATEATEAVVQLSAPMTRCNSLLAGTSPGFVLAPVLARGLAPVLACGLALGFASACGEPALQVDRPPPPANEGIYSFANGCYAVDATKPGSDNTRWLEAGTAPDPNAEDGAGVTVDVFSFSATEEAAGARFLLRASDLGTYLLYDAEGYYLTAQEGQLRRESELTSDILLLDDSYRSPAEWQLRVSAHDAGRFQLIHYQTGHYLTTKGLNERESEAAVIALYPQPSSECLEFPEMTLDADGSVEPRQWEDGDVYGFVETHAHLFTNYGFGGGGMFHGSAFHRLGVEHALPSCEPYHGAEGRQDLIGYVFTDLGDLDTDALLDVLTAGETPEFNHYTEGYPEFTDWPNSWAHATHQMQYYRWVERAYLGGLRLLVQHATTNQVLCDFMKGLGVQDTRYSCNDMVAVDRQIEETYQLERYIDAQHGGPGQGWFRVVTTPAEARDVINEGKLAVILGIETSNLFDCFLTPRYGFEECTPESIRADLDRYYALGVRAIFPVHKFDNGFSAGDGDRRVGQLGSFINSGHWSNMVLDCPDSPSNFDKGDVTFGGINMPRADYQEPAPNDMSYFAENPILTLFGFLNELQEPPLVGDYCQGSGLTELGETLILELMQRGMLIEVDHLPRRSFVRAYEMLFANDYPALGTHGNSNRGLLYQIGGVSKTGFGRCASPDRDGALADGFLARIQEIIDNGGYPGEGFGFDLNGFAGGPRPRFGDNSNCTEPQANPVTYPFTSHNGDITFTDPHLGNRTVDFNTEGMLHLGLLPELIEDVRRDGTTDEQLEPLFRSAEAYLRMWERAEERGAVLRTGG